MKKVTGFFKRLSQEMKLITKPTWKEEVSGTGLVFGLAVLSAVWFSALDSVFTSLLKLFIH